MGTGQDSKPSMIPQKQRFFKSGHGANVAKLLKYSNKIVMCILNRGVKTSNRASIAKYFLNKYKTAITKDYTFRLRGYNPEMYAFG